MQNEQRLTTDRWFGEIENRLAHLRETFEYITTNTPSEETLIEWILETTNAETKDGIRRRLRFLESVELLERSNNTYHLTERSQEFVATDDPGVLFAGLEANVIGFDALLEAATEQPLTDERCRDILAETDDFEGGVGVASRHREWLQMLGLIEESHDGDGYTLTERGHAIYQTLTSQNQGAHDSEVSFELNKRYVRRKLHDKYGGNPQSGISPSGEYPLIFLFTGSGGEEHGYDDEFLPDGTFKYTGEGQEGDMAFVRGNKAIRDHRAEDDELHLFWQEGGGMVRYLGQFEYADHEWVRLPDTHGDERDAIRFSLTPDGEVVIPDDGDFRRIDPSDSDDGDTNAGSDSDSDSTDRPSAVFMARGYKDDPFHRHVARSLANYLSASKRTELQQIIKRYQEQHETTFNADPVLNLLDSETVTAWGTKDKTQDVKLFTQMEPSDRFIMRTGQPSEVRFIQEVDLLLGEEVPLELRKELSDRIWTSPDYEYIWFSESKIADVHCPQEAFEEMVSEAVEGFEIEDWFPSQGKNFTRIDDDVLAELGGQDAFLKRLFDDFDGQLRTPGVGNHFLLNTGSDATAFTDSRFFELKQTAVDNWQQLRDAENDAAVVVHENGTLLGHGRLGNFEGERRDDGNYKLANIIDWHEVTDRSLDQISSELDLNFLNAADGSGISHPIPDPVTPMEADEYETLQTYLSGGMEDPATDTETTPDDTDYWDSLEIKRERLEAFIETPTQETLERLLDPAYFSTQRAYTFESDLKRILEQHDPKDIAEAIQTAAEDRSPGTLEAEIHGLGWTKASELLRLYQPNSYVMYTPRSKAGMAALGYAPPEIESEAAYLQFVDDVTEATEQFDLPDVAAAVSDRPIPEWVTDLDTADYLFSKHYDDDHDFELPPAGICAGEIASAPYYWVSQTNSPEEIEHEYLEATPDNRPGHDLSRLDEGDIVFHFTEGELIGYSEVTDTAAPTVTEDGLVCRVDVSLTEFDSPLSFAGVFEYLFQPDVRLDEYYPINYAGVNEGYLFNLSQDAGDYLLEQADVQESTDHALLDHYRGMKECDVWRFTASSSTLLTVLRRGKLPLSDGTAGIADQRDQWLATESGDLILLHVTSEEEHVDAIGTDSDNGIIGAAIVGDRDQKSERWCYDEHTELRYPYLVTLDELYVTSDLTEISFDEPLFSLDTDEMVREIGALTTAHIPWSTVSDRAQERLGHDLPLGVGNYTNLTEKHGGVANLVRPLLRDLAPHLQEVTPVDDLPGMLSPPADPPRTARRTELETELDRTGQVVLFGPPGTGKTFTATRFARWWIHAQTDRPKATRFRTVTFHPSFSYEDFMEGLTADATADGQVEYKYKDGTFKKIVEEARSAYLQADTPDQAPRYVLLIDEINRGNLSQIFGEAITQLEMDKRLGQPDAVTIQWAHSGESVALPPNLYLIGTMNTADRSIALVDAALRRRFGFLSFPPDYQVFVEEYEFNSQQAIRSLAAEVIATDRTQAGVPGKPDHYPLLALSIRALRAINENIVAQSDLTKGKRIGHSYLLGIETEAELVATWQHDILPLLEEYYFGDFDRLRTEVFNVDLTAETSIDSRLFDQTNHEIARIDADDLERALSTFVNRHEFR